MRELANTFAVFSVQSANGADYLGVRRFAAAARLQLYRQGISARHASRRFVFPCVELRVGRRYFSRNKRRQAAALPEKAWGRRFHNVIIVDASAGRGAPRLGRLVALIQAKKRRRAAALHTRLGLSTYRAEQKIELRM